MSSVKFSKWFDFCEGIFIENIEFGFSLDYAQSVGLFMWYAEVRQDGLVFHKRVVQAVGAQPSSSVNLSPEPVSMLPSMAKVTLWI